MGAAAALFCGIFVLLGVQMALGDDPAVGTGQPNGGSGHRQKAQGGGGPVLPPAQEAEPGYSEPRQQYYDRPYGEDGYYEQQPPAYGQGPGDQQPGYGQAPPQYAPPVQSGPS